MRAYFVYDADETEGCVVVADTVRAAIKLAANNVGLFDAAYFNVRARWIRNVNIDGLSRGVINSIECLKRDMCSYVTDTACPTCGATYVTIFKDEDNNNTIVCNKCWRG